MVNSNTQKNSQIALEILRQTVLEELILKAKLGHKAVVAGRNGRPRVVSARYLLRQDRPRQQP
ncbi:MAG: hypothetical protein GX564_04720 [Oligosphaeraceae bacterium]|nr:hypothetical protein [Oligosphaeraceae bacterium]